MTPEEKFNLINPTEHIKIKLILKFTMLLTILLIISGLFSFTISHDVAKMLIIYGGCSFVLYGVIYLICQMALLIKYRHVVGKKFIKHYLLSVVICGIFEGIF